MTVKAVATWGRGGHSLMKAIADGTGLNPQQPRRLRLPPLDKSGC